MKYIIIFTFLLISTLFAIDDIVVVDNVQKKLSDLESVPDATIVETFEVEDEASSYTQEEDISALPDATVVDVVEEPRNQNSIDVQVTNSTDCISAMEPMEVVSKETQCNTNQSYDCVTPPEEIHEQNQSAIVIVKTIENEKKKNQEIDFWKLLDETLLHSTKLILKKYDIAITKENMQVIKSEYYPNVSLSYAGEYYHSFEKGSSASIGGSFYPSFSQYRDSVGLSMQYELYRFGATDLKMEISQKELEIIRAELALDEERVSKELLKYFAQALKAQESIKYKKKIRLVQDLILQKKYRLYDAGKMDKTQLLRDERSLINLDKEILQHKLDFSDAVKNIQILSNITLDPSDVKFLMFEPKNSDIKTFEESMQAKYLELQIEVKRKELELIEKDYLPTIYMDSGYRLYGSDENDFFKSVNNIQRNSWDVGVTVSWNIFSGYKTDSTLVKKKVELQKLLEKYRLSKIEFESQEKKREMLKKTFDNILKAESKIIDHTFEQEEVYNRLHLAGKADTLQLDYIKIDIYKNELSFRSNVIERVYETILSELIL